MTGRVLLALAAFVALAGCGSSGPSAEQAFAADMNAFCKSAMTRGTAARQAYASLPSDASAAQRIKAFDTSWSATDETLADLARLQPPGPTGVTADEWSKAIADTRRDLLAYRDFYKRGYEALIRTFAASAGQSSATPAVAVFNSPAGQRFLHEQTRRGGLIAADTKRLGQLGTKIEQSTGVKSLMSCAGLGASIG